MLRAVVWWFTKRNVHREGTALVPIREGNGILVAFDRFFFLPDYRNKPISRYGTITIVIQGDQAYESLAFIFQFVSFFSDVREARSSFKCSFLHKLYSFH